MALSFFLDECSASILRSGQGHLALSYFLGFPRVSPMDPMAVQSPLRSRCSFYLISKLNLPCTSQLSDRLPLTAAVPTYSTLPACVISNQNLMGPNSRESTGFISLILWLLQVVMGNCLRLWFQGKHNEKQILSIQWFSSDPNRALSHDFCAKRGDQEYITPYLPFIKFVFNFLLVHTGDS